MPEAFEAAAEQLGCFNERERAIFRAGWNAGVDFAEREIDGAVDELQHIAAACASLEAA